MIRPLLTEMGCRRRQMRHCFAMREAGWDCFITGSARTIYSLTAALIPPEQPCLFLLYADGSSVLISAHSGPAFANKTVPITVYSPVKPVECPAHAAAAALAEELPRRQLRIGVDSANTAAAAWLEAPPEWAFEDAGPAVLALRRKKEEDEVDEICRSLALNAIAYDSAKRTIRPGITEIELHSAMSLAVARELGTAIPIAGDFSCGLRSVSQGGAPTERVIEAGDLCVLDLFIAPAYYFGDTCRTFCAGVPNTAQLDAWQLVRDTLRQTEALLKPGTRASDVYQFVRDTLDGDPLSHRSFWHHAGHGIGYLGHEAPRLVPQSTESIEEGDLIAVEPGVYVESLGGGLRLENTYEVGLDSAVSLFDYPIGLELA